MIRHLSSPYYATDTYFRECCEAKLMLGAPGTSTREAKELSGRHQIVTDEMAAQAEADEAQQHASLTIGGGMSRVTFAPGDTAKAMGEAAQRKSADEAQRAAARQQQE
jgi:hypothetical protein